MKTKQEIKEWLLENAVSELGNIDLSGIDFGDLEVDFSKIKAKYINNGSQKANYIYNSSQEATNYIYNRYQKANYIYNSSQEATNYIYNGSQEATKYFNTHNAILNGIKYEVDNTDNVYVIIKTKQTRNGITIIKGFDRSNNKVWLYKNDIVAYHASTKQEAKEGFKNKLKGFEIKQDIINKIKQDGYITREQYHELTGACEMGIQDFAERVGKPNEDKLTLKELKELLQPSDWGYEYIIKWLGE
jgi:hypothetical protein